MRDWNYRFHQKSRGGKCGTKQLWKAEIPVGLELSFLLLVLCFQLSSNGFNSQLVNAITKSNFVNQVALQMPLKIILLVG